MTFSKGHSSNQKANNILTAHGNFRVAENLMISKVKLHHYKLTATSIFFFFSFFLLLPCFLVRKLMTEQEHLTYGLIRKL